MSKNINLYLALSSVVALTALGVAATAQAESDADKMDTAASSQAEPGMNKMESAKPMDNKMMGDKMREGKAMEGTKETVGTPGSHKVKTIYNKPKAKKIEKMENPNHIA